jgi:hypothetical protein
VLKARPEYDECTEETLDPREAEVVDEAAPSRLLYEANFLYKVDFISLPGELFDTTTSFKPCWNFLIFTFNYLFTLFDCFSTQ